MTPVVSVIMPTYNYGRFISRAIDSVLSQTYSDFELIIIDDGSEDDTTKIVQQFHDMRIKYYRQENQGPSRARNAGIAQAQGEYLAFIDADDEWLPYNLSYQVTALANDHRVGMVYGHCVYVDASGQILRTVKGKAHGKLFIPMLRENIIGGSPSIVVVRASCFRQIGGFAPLLYGNEDWHMWLRIAFRWEIGVVDHIVARITDHSSSASKNKQMMMQDTARMLSLLHSELDKQVSPRVWHRAWSYASMGAGHFYALRGEFDPARRAFWDGVRHDPTNLSAMILWAAALLGPRWYSYVWKIRDLFFQRGKT